MLPILYGQNYSTNPYSLPYPAAQYTAPVSGMPGQIGYSGIGGRFAPENQPLLSPPRNDGITWSHFLPWVATVVTPEKLQIIKEYAKALEDKRYEYVQDVCNASIKDIVDFVDNPVGLTDIRYYYPRYKRSRG